MTTLRCVSCTCVHLGWFFSSSIGPSEECEHEKDTTWNSSTSRTFLHLVSLMVNRHRPNRVVGGVDGETLSLPSTIWHVFCFVHFMLIVDQIKEVMNETQQEMSWDCFNRCFFVWVRFFGAHSWVCFRCIKIIRCTPKNQCTFYRN